MPLIATSNEHSSKLLRMKDRMKEGEFTVSKKPLLAGDYMFEAHSKTVGIEVKWSLSDLLDSLKTVGENSGPRLAVEVKKLHELVDIAFLIIPPLRARGDGKVYRDDGQVSGWEYNSVKGILTDCQMAGVLVDEWDGDIAQRIAQLYYVISHKEHGWIQQRGRPDFASIDPQYTRAVWALCSFDRIGPVTAEALLVGRSVADVTHMSLKELLAVEGIGPKTAQSLLEEMTRKF